MKRFKTPILLLCALILTAALSGCGVEESRISWEKSEILNGEYILLQADDQDERYVQALQDWKDCLFFDAYDGMKAVRDEAARKWGEASLEAAALDQNLGALCLDLAKYEEGYEYLNSAYVTFRDQLGEDSEQALAVKASLCRYEFLTGDYDTALKESASILETAREDRDLTACTVAQGTQAEILENQGLYSQALAAYSEILQRIADLALEDGLEEYDSCLGAAPEERHENAYLLSAIQINRLGRVYGRMHDVQNETKNYYHLAKMFDNGQVSREHVGFFADVCLNLSQAQGQHGLAGNEIYHENIAFFMDLAQETLAKLRPEHPGYIRLNLLTAQNLYYLGGRTPEEADRAEACFREAVRISEACYGRNHPSTAYALQCYASFAADRYHEEGAFNQRAAELAEESVDIRKNILAYRNPGTAQMYMVLAALSKPFDEEKFTEYTDLYTTIHNELGIVLLSREEHELFLAYVSALQNRDAGALLDVMAMDYAMCTADALSELLGFPVEEDALVGLYEKYYQEAMERFDDYLRSIYGEYRVEIENPGGYVYTSQDIEEAVRVMSESIPGAEQVKLEGARRMKLTYKIIGETQMEYFKGGLFSPEVTIFRIDGKWKLGTPMGFPKMGIEEFMELKP